MKQTMPELPEVETVRTGLQIPLSGRTLAAITPHCEGLRFPFPDLERLSGRTITSVGRRAKYLLIHFDDGHILLSHLGMTGTFRFEKPGYQRRKHDHITFSLNTTAPESELVYADPRRFGFFDLFTEDMPSRFVKNLGPEPLSNTFSAQDLADRLKGRKTSIKSMLLDQGVIAGLGNIYVCEALYRVGLDPRTPAGNLVKSDGTPDPVIDRLISAIKDILIVAIAAGGSTLRDYRQANGEAGSFQQQFSVYGRAGQSCNGDGCSGIIERIVQNTRSSFFCPECQRHLTP